MIDIAGPSVFQPRWVVTALRTRSHLSQGRRQLSARARGVSTSLLTAVFPYSFTTPKPLRVSVMFMPLSNSLPVLGSSEIALNQYMWLEPNYRNRNIQLTKQCRNNLLPSSRLSITVGVGSSLLYSLPVLRLSPFSRSSSRLSYAASPHSDKRGGSIHQNLKRLIARRTIS